LKNKTSVATQAPGVASVFKADYGFMLTSGAPVVTWVLYLLALAFKPQHASLALGAAVVVTLLSWPAAWMRWRALQRLFTQGQPCEAQITSVWLSGDRGRVEFSYQFQGKLYQSGMALHRSARAEALEQGETVTLLVDPDQPQKAILPQLFE
jgi:hypothetical protein